MPNIDTLLLSIRDGSSWKERVFAFAALPQDMQRVVLDAGKTISEGAKFVLAFVGDPLLPPLAA